MSETPESEGTRLAKDVAGVVARLRKAEGWTLDELADSAGIHRTSVGLIERGERRMTLASAFEVAKALGTDLSTLVAMAEVEVEGVAGTVPKTPRRLDPSVSLNSNRVEEMCGLKGPMIRHAIESAYDTLDLIDTELIKGGAGPIAGLVELANLSSMIGNLLSAGLAKASDGLYVRNKPHTFPDLVPRHTHLPDLELKMALETNSPKGHLTKAGTYITFRYGLGDANGGYVRPTAKQKNRGLTPWVWEVRVGALELDDFALSKTAGDSGKTAVIKTDSLKAMTLAFEDERFYPYARRWA